MEEENSGGIVVNVEREGEWSEVWMEEGGGRSERETD